MLLYMCVLTLNCNTTVEYFIFAGNQFTHISRCLICAKLKSREKINQRHYLEPKNTRETIK